MPCRRALPFLLALMALAAPATAAAADKPRPGALYSEGPSGRYLLGGHWLFRLDPSDRGLSQRLHRSTGTAGWTRVTVPNAWNAGDESRESMAGSVGWYRKDFELPSAAAALDWAVRFESVNYRSRVWLNGRPVGANRGAYVPFELPLRALKRRGTNRLVIRVDSRRRPTDFPPSGLNAVGVPTGGWWNYGGILREVYLQRIDGVAFKEVRVLPRLPCGSCDARIGMRAVLRNVGRARAVSVTGRFGGRTVRLGSGTMRGGSLRRFAASFTLRNPRLWTPQDPNLYSARIDVSSGGRRLASYDLKTGVRSTRVSEDGRLLLNGRALSFRGVGYHEDDREKGFAIGNDKREWLVREAQAIGATLMRTHYPPHPYLMELADRRGMMIWLEAPVYAVKTDYLKERAVRDAATDQVRRMVRANWNHPSVLVYSIGNELSSKPGPTQSYYIRRAASAVRRLDPTRATGIAVAGYPSSGCHTEYGPLDVIGINEYFGWYPGPSGQLFDRANLSPYLDALRACYPREALVVSEFGAEANRDGPVEEKGTWLFQQDFVNFHLGVHDSKPWLSGSIYWALNEFRVRPEWEGGNPRPQPPIHQKGLVTYDGKRKPAWADVGRRFKATQQIAPR